MRKLMWFAVGFTAACVAGAYLINGTWLLILAGFLLVAGLALWMLKTKNSRIAAVAVLGCITGLVWLFFYDWLYLAPARDLDGQQVQATVEISDYSNGVPADGVITLDDKQYRVQLYIDTDAELKPGDRVQGEFKLRYTANGGEKAPTAHQGKGIFLVGYGRGAMQITRGTTDRFWAANLRRYIQIMLDKVFPQDTLAFARALLLGDSSLLSYETDTDFKITGIRHVIAVSGMHVSILFSMIYLLSGKKRGLTAILGIPTLIAFAAVAGFTPSIVRACVMQILMILGLLLNKEYDPPTALSFAVLVMLTVNPLTVTSVSFQLSVSCMIGIFLFSGRIRGYLLNEKRLGPAKGKSLKARLTRWGVGSVSVTLGAMIVTTPLCAYYFEMVSLVGILTNLLTLWVVSFIFYGIMAACIFGAIWLPLGQGIGWIASWPIRYVLGVTDVLADIPFAAVYTQSVYVVLWLVFCYIALTVLLLSKEKHIFLYSGCILAVLCAALTLSYWEGKQDSYRFTVLDVGQGQCLLLQFEDKNYMVDCGGDTGSLAADKAAQTLLSQGITSLDGVILTHFDADHAGGVMMLLSRVPAQRLYLPQTPDKTDTCRSLQKTYGERIYWMEEDVQIKLDDAPITLISGEITDDDNESGLCVLFQPENCDILITGDRGAPGEKELLKSIELPELELLVVGHHGAQGAACMELLRVTRPAVAVISVGVKNSYGHPSQDVMDRLQAVNAKILRTDLDGTVIIRG